jgi:hypothetical protein
VAFQAIINDVDAAGEERYFAAWYPATHTSAFSAQMHALRLADKPSPPLRLRTWATYDFAQMRPVILCRASADAAGQEVAAATGGQIIARAALRDDGDGYPRAQLVLPAPAAGQSYKGLELRLGNQTMEVRDMPNSGLLASARRLVDRRQQLTEQFGLDRPWDDLATAADLVRKHRGMVARACEWLDVSLPLDGERRLAGLAEAADSVEAVLAGADYIGAQRNEFMCAYYSQVDGSGQPFVARVPENLDPAKSYPLIVMLHGRGGRPEPARGRAFRGEFLAVQPWGRGDLGYRALAEDDVLQVIAYMRRWY